MLLRILMIHLYSIFLRTVYESNSTGVQQLFSLFIQFGIKLRALDSQNRRMIIITFQRNGYLKRPRRLKLNLNPEKGLSDKK
jgi:hypothetical protein